MAPGSARQRTTASGSKIDDRRVPLDRSLLALGVLTIEAHREAADFRCPLLADYRTLSGHESPQEEQHRCRGRRQPGQRQQAKSQPRAEQVLLLPLRVVETEHDGVRLDRPRRQVPGKKVQRREADHNEQLRAAQLGAPSRRRSEHEDRRQAERQTEDCSRHDLHTHSYFNRAKFMVFSSSSSP